MIITLCGSTKFKEDFLEMQKQLTMDDHIVLSVGLFAHADEIELTAEQKIRLDNLHKQKINMSDAIFVINRDGYIGESTYGEIDWARRMNKEVYFLENPTPEEENKTESTNTESEEVSE